MTEKYDKIIALGSDCTIVESLKKAGVKSYSYPFDWNVSINATDVANVLYNDFLEYTKVENKLITEEPDGDKNRITRMNKYNIGFVHYSEIALSEFEKIFMNRIERFRNSLKNNSILFIRSEHTTYRSSKNNCDNNNIEDIENLRNSIKFLREKYENNFHCIVIITCDGCRDKYNNILNDKNITVYNAKSKITGNMAGIDVYDDIIKNI